MGHQRFYRHGGEGLKPETTRTMEMKPVGGKFGTFFLIFTRIVAGPLAALSLSGPSVRWHVRGKCS